MKGNKMKAILVAGGEGSRLLPFTRYTHKTLLPLHNRPVIDYALGTIRRAGITDITIIGNRFIGQIAQHVGVGLETENIHYVIEEDPKGVGHALNLARPHVEGHRILIYFSDNIISAELVNEVTSWKESDDPPGALLLGYNVDDPSSFGVGVFDEAGGLIDIVEKPLNPPSNMAIGGIYLFDEDFWKILDEEMESKKERFSITDINKRYLQNQKVNLKVIGKEVWLDCGTPDSLLEAAIFAREGILSPFPCNYKENDPYVDGA